VAQRATPRLNGGPQLRSQECDKAATPAMLSPLSREIGVAMLFTSTRPPPAEGYPNIHTPIYFD
jgi:hypothetical protein